MTKQVPNAPNSPEPVRIEPKELSLWRVVGTTLGVVCFTFLFFGTLGFLAQGRWPIGIADFVKICGAFCAVAVLQKAIATRRHRHWYWRASTARLKIYHKQKLCANLPWRFISKVKYSRDLYTGTIELTLPPGFEIKLSGVTKSDFEIVQAFHLARGKEPKKKVPAENLRNPPGHSQTIPHSPVDLVRTTLHDEGIVR